MGQIVYKQMRIREGFYCVSQRFVQKAQSTEDVDPYRSFAVKSLISSHSGNEFFQR